MRLEVYEPKTIEDKKEKPLLIKLTPGHANGAVAITVVDDRGDWVQTLATIDREGISVTTLTDSFIKEYNIPTNADNHILTRDSGCLRSGTPL